MDGRRSNDASAASAAAWPLADGEQADRIRTFDWAATPLGPIEAWPVPLRCAVDILLGSGHPMLVLWGPELVVLYNDA